MKFEGPITGRLAGALDWLVTEIRAARLGKPLEEILKECDTVLDDYFKHHSGRLSDVFKNTNLHDR